MTLDYTIPRGNGSNPSAWSKRVFLLILAILGFLIALYLGLYQLHFFSTVWEPFFGNGTNAVVESSFSRSLPVPDGLIGAFGYLCDVVLVSIGDGMRWRTKPLAVILYSVLVAIMGFVSILLIIAQPVFLHTFCTLCLASAILSLSMVIPAMHELQASRNYIKKEKRNGRNFWEVVKEN
ncbi:MAG: vitamin K epoxide reductase [Bacteroidota bacterium]|nr:vitamin K epoxide reductase [Bacteroidota bacterium]